MKSMITNKELPDDKAYFLSGMLYIICRDDKGKYDLGVIYIDPQYAPDTVLSLKDIAERYPDVKLLIHDDYLDGEIFSYGNYNKGEWVLYGTTRGFA